MYNVGIIGIGRIAAELPDNHVKAYIDCIDTKITALCDTNISKAWDCRAKYKLDCECYENIEDMPPLDIVSICTRPEIHWTNLISVVDFIKPKAIYCEKPIAVSIDEAEWMISRCEDAGIILQINHQRRFGRARVSFARGMENTGTHVFDWLRILFGDIRQYDSNSIITPNGIIIDINEIQSAEHIFKFEVPPDPKGLIRLGVEHIVDCINTGKPTISSGKDGLEALRLCLQFKK